MAIRTQGIVTVDDSRNFFLNNLTFSDSSSVSSLGLVPGSLKWVLDNPNAFDASGQDDQFGTAIACSDEYLIVGAHNEDDSSGTTSGKAYIFNVTTGALLWTLDNPNAYSTSLNDIFGFSVSISGNYAIVGAYGEDDSGGTGSGKAYIFNVTTGALLWTLNNPNAYSTSASDFFGYSVSISGNYAIVGAYSEDDSGGTVSGKAYIFNVTTGALVHTLNNPNAYSTSAGDNFGYSVSISGNYAIVGAYFEDDSGGTGSGKAYIFNVTTGALVHTLNNPNAYSTSVNDYFGISVSISGNYAIVGAYAEADSGGDDSGKAYIFNIETTRNSNYVEEIQFTNGTTLNLLADKAFQSAHPGGALIHTLNNPNAYSTSLNDYFGYSVSISGNYAIVGARLEDESGGDGSGKAYIFNVTTGALVHTLNNPNAYSASLGDEFGVSVSISGNYAIVGAYYEDDSPSVGFESGKAYIFNVTTGQLVHILNNPNAYSTSAEDFFGHQVSISGNYAIVGAYREDDSGGIRSGKAYIFNVTTGALVHTLNNPNAYSTSDFDQFAWSLSISGNYAIVGAVFEDDSGGTVSGKAYIFNVTTGALLWTLDNPNAYSTSAGDEFGHSVSISGNYAIVGALDEADSGGTFSGKAYIFNVTTGALVHTLNNPNVYSTSASDSFGWSVSIFGNYAIVGAYQEDDSGGLASGKAYIFNVTTGALVHTLNNPNAYSTSTNDQFGWSVAIDGNYVIVGTPDEDDSGGNSSGKAYIFSVSDLTYLDKILTVAESIF
jgi:outer membrane protein assembly factor BamB